MRKSKYVFVFAVTIIFFLSLFVENIKAEEDHFSTPIEGLPIYNSCAEEWVYLDGNLKVQFILTVSDDGNVNSKFQINVHASGPGEITYNLYQFMANAGFHVNLDTADLAPFIGSFDIKTHLVGQGPANNDGKLSLKVHITRSAEGDITAFADSWRIECQKSSFEKITSKLGPGFGDQWNKYAWSMKDYNGHMYVGTSSRQ